MSIKTKIYYNDDHKCLFAVQEKSGIALRMESNNQGFFDAVNLYDENPEKELKSLFNTYINQATIDLSSFYEKNSFIINFFDEAGYDLTYITEYMELDDWSDFVFSGTNDINDDDDISDFGEGKNSRHYYIHYPQNFDNEYDLYWVDNPNDERELIKQGYKRISKSEAINICKSERLARKNNSSFSGYGNSIIMPFNFDGDEDKAKQCLETPDGYVYVYE